MKSSIRRHYAAFLVAGFGLAALPLHASANGLIGTSVTGGLFFSGGTINYYDSANGFVPTSGYLNSGGGTTVTIASPAVEFGFMDAHNTDFANFSASQFTLEDVLDSTAGGTDAPFKMTFTDTAFSGLALAKVSDSFPNGGLTAVLSGTTLTVTWGGGPIHANDDYTSTFIYTAVPEPGTWAAMGIGAGALALMLRRKQSARA